MDSLNDQQRHSLDMQGYVIFHGAFSDVQSCQARLEFDRLCALEGDSGGKEIHTEFGAQRISDIFNKSTGFDFCLKCPLALAAAHHVLGEFKLHGANLRNPLLGYGEQKLHVDEGRDPHFRWRILNCLILFDDMNASNGATRVVPGSHFWPAPVQRSMARKRRCSEQEKARFPHDLRAPYPGEIVISASVGSIVAINGSLWHGGTRNIDGSKRRQLHLSFTRRDCPQQLDQRKCLTPFLYKRFDQKLRNLLDVEDSLK